MSDKKLIDPKQEAYVMSLVDFVNRLPLSKDNKLKFVEEMVKHKESAFVNKKDELEQKDEGKNLPLFFNAETGKATYANDSDTSYQSVGDENKNQN